MVIQDDKIGSRFNRQGYGLCFALPQATARKKGTNELYPPLKAGYHYVNEAAFFYMVLGEYSPQPAQQLISREWINNARSRWDSYVSTNGQKPPAYTYGVAGLDVGEFGSDPSVMCVRYGGYVEPLLS